jgi:hypothetical protein
MLVMRVYPEKGNGDQGDQEKESENLPSGAICEFCFAYIHVCSQCKRDAMQVMLSTVPFRVCSECGLTTTKK